MIDKEAKVLALRQELKNGRIDQASRDVDSDHANDDKSLGTTFQAAGGEVGGLARDGKQTTDHHRQSKRNGRSIKEKLVRERSGDRRPSESNGSTLDVTSTTESAADSRSVGRIVTDAPIPTRKIEPDKPEGAFEEGSNIKQSKGSRKTQVPPEPKASSGFKLPTFSKGNVLSEREAKEIAEPFLAALESDFETLDSYLWMRQKSVGIDTHNQPVWSDLDSEEIQALTRIMLRWGQHNGTAAVVVRGVVDSADYIQVGTIFIPRIKRSVEIMRETRKPRLRRGQSEHSH